MVRPGELPARQAGLQLGEVAATAGDRTHCVRYFFGVICVACRKATQKLLKLW